MDGSLLFVLLESLRFLCETTEPFEVCGQGRPTAQLHLRPPNLSIHRTSAAPSSCLSIYYFWFHFIFLFSALFVPFSFSFIYHFKIHHFFILFAILEPFDTPSQTAHNNPKCGFFWAEMKEGTHAHTQSDAVLRYTLGSVIWQGCLGIASKPSDINLW